jgi:murein DD-endopeptidase MepM/ murein hydrolase activator NlpD
MAVGDKISSPVWGNKAYEVTQEWGVLGADPSLYPAGHGLPAGYHGGLDIGVPKYTPIYALNPGEVIWAGFKDTFRPNPVFIRTKDNPDTPFDEEGYTEIYGHLWADSVQQGASVKPGDKLGISGEQTLLNTMTPDGTGPHLHFELYGPDDMSVNPTRWLQQKTVPISDNGETNGGGVSGDTPTSTPDIGGILDILKSVSERSVVIVVGIVLLAVALITIVR